MYEAWCQNSNGFGIVLSSSTFGCLSLLFSCLYIIGSLMTVLLSQLEATLFAANEVEHARSKAGL